MGAREEFCGEPFPHEPRSLASPDDREVFMRTHPGYVELYEGQIDELAEGRAPRKVAELAQVAERRAIMPASEAMAILEAEEAEWGRTLDRMLKPGEYDRAIPFLRARKRGWKPPLDHQECSEERARDICDCYNINPSEPILRELRQARNESERQKIAEDIVVLSHLGRGDTMLELIKDGYCSRQDFEDFDDATPSQEEEAALQERENAIAARLHREEEYREAQCKAQWVKSLARCDPEWVKSLFERSPVEAAAEFEIEQASAIPTNTTRSDVKTPEPQRIDIAATAQPKPLNWRELAKRGEPPSRRWAIPGWWGFGHVTSMVGPSGIGKTLGAQQMGSCLALGRNFIGEIASPLRVLMWCCEDDHDELWRRAIAIAEWLGVPLSDFSDNLIIEPRAGMENTLASSEFGRLMFAPLIEELRQQAGDYRADCVILDNSAQLFGGNENDRHQVTSFLNNLTGTLKGKAIMLLAHPARSAGSEFSGSGAWEAVVRTRLFLGSKLPDEAADNDEPDDTVRYLCRRKANYTGKDYRRFQFRNGVLVPDEVEASASGGIIGHLYDRAAERAVLEGLKRLQEMGLQPSEGATTSRYLPRLLLDYKLGEGRSKAELAGAMRRLMLDGKLVKSVVGKYVGNRSPMYGLTVAE